MFLLEYFRGPATLDAPAFLRPGVHSKQNDSMNLQD